MTDTCRECQGPLQDGDCPFCERCETVQAEEPDGGLAATFRDTARPFVD